MNCGIIGLPNVGKTALFNLLTENSASSSNYPYCTVEPNLGMARIKDHRLDKLSLLFKDAAVTCPHVKFTDVAGLPPGAAKGEGLGNRFLSHIRNVYGILHVVRTFSAPQVSRFDSSPSDPVRDIELVNTELMLSDMEIAQRRLDEDPGSYYWKEAAAALSSGTVPPADEEGVLLSCKPQITVLNITTGTERPEVDCSSVIYIDVAFQQELLLMDEAERKEFAKDLPEWESSSVRIIDEVRKMLGQITFYTIVGGRELKGYSIPGGTDAYSAAGKIHTDIQRGFVRAKVYKYSSLERCGFNMEELKKSGEIRTEGRDYIIEDGDIVEILFSG